MVRTRTGRTIFALLFIIAVVLGAGCGGSRPGPQTTDPPAAQPGGKPGTAAGTEPSASPDLSFVDATGTRVVLQKPVQRIACLAELCVDMLAELGMKPVAAFGTLHTRPEYWGNEGKEIPPIKGSFSEPNVESILSARPDLVVGWPSHAGLREALAPTPMMIVGASGYHDVIGYLKTMGRLTDRSAQAEAAARQFLDKLAEYKRLSPRNRTVLLMWGDSGSAEFGIDTEKSVYGSLLNEIARYPWPATSDATKNGLILSYSLEKVLEVNPDVIFVATFVYGNGPTLVQQLKSHPLWKELKAVKNGDVHEVDVDLWVTAQGTRALGRVLDRAMRVLYPDVMKGRSMS